MELLDILDLMVQDTETLNRYINKTVTKDDRLATIESHSKNYAHDTFTDIIRKTPYKNGIPSIDIVYQPICRIASMYDGEFKMPRFVKRVLPQKTYYHGTTKVLPFSGGKVSLAIALRYRNIGENLHLFYVHNNIKKYGVDDGLERVKKLAEMLDMPLHVEEVDYKYFEYSVMKNGLIISRALKFAVENVYSPEILYGTFDTAFLSNNDYEKEGMNCVEIMSAYKDVMKKHLFDSRLITPYPAYSMVWDELIRNRRFIPYVKCEGAIENRIWYIAQVDHNLLEEENPSIYMKYIKDLQKSLKSKAGDIIVLWNRYFFYRIEKSKHYQELMELPK